MDPEIIKNLCQTWNLGETETLSLTKIKIQDKTHTAQWLT